jgi:hypothetical protein
MGTSHHWNWTGAQPLTANVAQIGVAVRHDPRGNPGSLSLSYIATDGELLNAEQRFAGDSTSWEFQPALSTTPAAEKRVAVKAKSFAFGEGLSGTLD